MRRALIATLIMAASTAGATAADDALLERLARLEGLLADTEHRFDELAKKVDDVLWYERVGDIAVVDWVRIYGPPPWKQDNPTALGAGNHVKFYCYVFTPRASFDGKRLPLLVLPHGGVHADFTTYHAHIVRELVAQGYVVIAPDYRGSTGYGKGFYELIDYGGLEVDDAVAAREWAVANHPRVDPDRVGIIGWSHGGLIALMALFDHPGSFRCAFAGVPVSDLVQRMGYYGQDYRDLYEADYFLGQSARENLEEYKRRSPVWHVAKLERPLRIHTNRHDDDVAYIEVEHLVQALKAAGKEFELEVSDAPGGHSFDRLDTPEAWGYRRKIYGFLARYLEPPRPDVPLGVSPEGRAAP
jgi:dipeptidyl aminopeptidase/acylaminoacyl peptidase